MAGKTKVRPALDAGYSESYAYKSSFALIEPPQIKTFLTEAYRAKGLTPDKIIQPVLDAYEAKIKVFSRAAGGLILTEDPDHEIRLKAYDRAVAAFGVIPREVEMPPPQRPGLVVILGRESDKAQSVAKSRTPSASPLRKPIDVTFRLEQSDYEKRHHDGEQ